MNSKYDAILLRFPELREKIKEQIEVNEDFKSLCADYQQCTEMINSLNIEPTEIRSTLEEYTEIKIELEQEVMKFLFK